MAAMDLGAINYVATAVSAVVLMVLGFAWYAPFLFGKAWMAALGKSEEEMRAAGPSPALVAALADAILTSLVLAIVFQAAKISGIGAGIVAALGLAIAFSGMSIISNGAFEGRPRALVLINLGYRLVSYPIVGIILSIW
ncbi:MAG: DUF1761 domain-containing protein [Spirochaetaceae bacterium]|nr:DUF1761 domain-containing protein [Spirochaetaceae bacterium]